MFTPCKYLVHSILLFLSVLMKSWLIPKVLEDRAYSFFIPRSWAVVGLNNLHRNVPCYLLRFPTQIFARVFKRGSGLPMVLSSRSKCMILTYGREICHLLPISKADMWSLWVGKCMHTLVTCIA